MGKDDHPGRQERAILATEIKKAAYSAALDCGGGLEPPTFGL
jgi:hypothetical protein